MQWQWNGEEFAPRMRGFGEEWTTFGARK